jgi:hypothetical protein
VFATSDHDRPWPSPAVTSACAGSLACSDPLGGPRRTRTTRSWCSATRCVSSSANSMCALPIALWIGRSSPLSPGCWRDGAGAPSSSRQRRSFVGTESSRGANGGAGDPLVVLVGRPLTMSSSSSSSGSPERTGAGAVFASRASFEALEIPRTKRRRPTLNAFSAIEVLVPYTMADDGSRCRRAPAQGPDRPFGALHLAQDPYTAVNLGEAYRHHKTIAAWGTGQNILRACAIAPGSARRHHHRQADARVRHQAHRGNRLAPPLEPRFCLDLMNTGPGAVGGAMGRVRRVASWRRRGSSRWLCIDRLLRLLAEPPGDTILDEPQVAIRAGRQRKRRNLSPKTG